MFPSGSQKEMSVGLASYPRAFFIGHAFGLLQAEGFLFPSCAPKATSTGFSSYPRAFFIGHAFGLLWARGFFVFLLLAKGNKR